MAKTTTNLNVPASVANSDTLQKSAESVATLYLTGAGTYSIQPQVSLDGTNWLDDGSALSAPGTHKFSVDAPYVRVDVASYTSGTPVGIVLHDK